MTPIAIVTRNRHTVLDVTLRSLSATRLPEDQVLIIFDDASDNPETLNYLYSDKTVPLTGRWLRHQAQWPPLVGSAPHQQQGRGLAGLVPVVRMGRQPRGVVEASCTAFHRMVTKFGQEHGILMCQDDVVFNADWFERLQDAEHKPEDSQRPVGLIAGCWINKHNAKKREPMTKVDQGGITAQCYYISPAGIAAALPWASRTHGITRGFDNKFCAAIRENADTYRMHPAVCQHIGIESLVRPNWAWNQWNAKGRIDFSARGPYPLAKCVRKFEDK